MSICIARFGEMVSAAPLTLRSHALIVTPLMRSRL